MNNVDKLTQIFSHFPGIGPRQARRFVYYLLSRTDGTLDDFAKNIVELKKEMVTCKECLRFFQKRHAGAELCSICTDKNRDHETLMLLQRDVDLESVEKSEDFKGTYFILGGSVKILEKEPEKKIRIKELLDLIEKKKPKEIILGMNWNPEGENTADYVSRMIQKLKLEYNIKITKLGKGLSMGTELEYTDPDTLKNALKNRS